MTTSKSNYLVRDEYTDERLIAESKDMSLSLVCRMAAVSLLEIPADWRQSVWAEANAKFPKDEFDAEVLGNEITSQVIRFLKGYRPRRMETQVS